MTGGYDRNPEDGGAEVPGPELTVKVSPVDLSMREGTSHIFTANLYDSDDVLVTINAVLTWESLNPEIADVVVKNGQAIVTAKSPGDAVIVARYGDSSGSARLEVVASEEEEERRITDVQRRPRWPWVAAAFLVVGAFVWLLASGRIDLGRTERQQVAATDTMRQDTPVEAVPADNAISVAQLAQSLDTVRAQVRAGDTLSLQVAARTLHALRDTQVVTQAAMDTSLLLRARDSLLVVRGAVAGLDSTIAASAAVSLGVSQMLNRIETLLGTQVVARQDSIKARQAGQVAQARLQQVPPPADTSRTRVAQRDSQRAVKPSPTRQRQVVQPPPGRAGQQAQAQASSARFSIQRDGCLRHPRSNWPDGRTVTPYTASSGNSYPRSVVWAVCDRTYDRWEDIRITRLVYLEDSKIECMAGGCLPVRMVAICTWNPAEAQNEARTGFGYCDNAQSVAGAKGRFTSVGNGRWELASGDFPGDLRDGDIYLYRGEGLVPQSTEAFVSTQHFLGYLPDREPVNAVIPFLVYDGVGGTHGEDRNHTDRDLSLVAKYNATVENFMARVCLKKDPITGLMMPCVDDKIICVTAHAREEDAFSFQGIARSEPCWDPQGLKWYFDRWLPRISQLNSSTERR